MSRILVLSLLLSAAVAGCGSGAEPPDNPDVVATVQKQSFPFSTARTFVLPDHVAEITDGSGTPGPSPLQTSTLDPATQQLILNTIATNMTERGYVRLTDPLGPKPDIFIQTSVIQTTSTQVYYDSWYSYWGGFYGPWYAGYAPGWGTVPVSYVVTSTVGTLVIEFTDPNRPQVAEKRIPSIWVGLVTGATTGASTSDIQSRVQSGINQAFEQSPYIGRQQ